MNEPQVCKLFDDSLRVAAEELDVDVVCLSVLDEETQTLLPLASIGVSQGDLSELQAQVAAGSLGTSPARLDSDLPSGPIALSVPVKAERGILGTLSVGPRRSGGRLRIGDAAYLYGLAGQLAVVIENTRRSGELRPMIGALGHEPHQRANSALRAPGR